jgi:hypothetical protein
MPIAGPSQLAGFVCRSVTVCVRILVMGSPLSVAPPGKMPPGGGGEGLASVMETAAGLTAAAREGGPGDALHRAGAGR